MFDVSSAMTWKMQLMNLGSFFKPKQIFTKYLCVCIGRGGGGSFSNKYADIRSMLSSILENTLDQAV